MKALIFALVLPLLQAGPVLTEEEEARAQDLMREIRCAACENEPISQSSADIAENMRDRVRVLIADGASDEDVRDWFASRYGEFVLFRPNSEGPGGWLLWGGPFLLLTAAAAGIWTLASRRSAAKSIDAIPPEKLQD